MIEEALQFARGREAEALRACGISKAWDGFTPILVFIQRELAPRRPLSLNDVASQVVQRLGGTVASTTHLNQAPAAAVSPAAKSVAVKQGRGKSKTRSAPPAPRRVHAGNFREVYICNILGDPTGCERNVALLLRFHDQFAGRLAFNEFTQTVMCHRPSWSPDDPCEREWTDADDIFCAEFAQMEGMPAKPGTVASAVQIVARENRYHPVRMYFRRVVWDGKPRLSAFLTTYLGAKIDDGRVLLYVEAVARAWLISAVARVMQPGCKADHMLILEGEQGKRKSSAIAALLPVLGWFTDQIADFGTKDAAQDIVGILIAEVAELSSMRRTDVDRVKAFVARAVDRYRPSYGRRSIHVPRQCVFVGTTNKDAYLQDETGNRRFWPVFCTAVDVEGIIRDRDQIWAEAVAAYDAGEKWWLSPEIEELARHQQAARLIDDPWAADVIDWAEGSDGISVACILERMDVPKERRDQAMQNRVARILNGAGFQRIQVRREGKRIWLYRRPSPDGTTQQVASGDG